MSGLTVIAPMICAGCDQPLPPPSKKGRPRKWCSDKCRRSQRSKQRAAARAQPRICAGCDRLVPPNSSKGGRTRKWCSDECKRRTWDRENVIVFCACGQRIAPESARQGTTQCRKCFNAAEEQRIRERAERIAAMWADGQTLNEIAATLGWTPGHLSVEFDCVRRRWPGLLPYRSRTWKGKPRAGVES
jgi:hypothetical protein